MQVSTELNCRQYGQFFLNLFFYFLAHCTDVTGNKRPLHNDRYFRYLVIFVLTVFLNIYIKYLHLKQYTTILLSFRWRQPRLLLSYKNEFSS